MSRKKSYLTVTDQFCGAGGSSLGAARLGAEVRWAMNHWQTAIKTHWLNFPETAHDCADLLEVSPKRYDSTDILITSPECVNHSISKGKKRLQKQLSLLEKQEPDPAEQRSRATMESVVHFTEVHRYNFIVVENVVDVRDWVGFDSWLQDMVNLGYDYHIVYFNSMFGHLRPLERPQQGDYAPQSRDRLYVVFWRKGNRRPDLEFRPLAWCPNCEQNVEAIQTWKQTEAVRRFGGRWGRYRFQYIYTCPHCSRPKKLVEVKPYYYAAFNAIDWSIPIPRIGDREKPLKERTLARIRKGLERFGNQYLVIDLSFGGSGFSAQGMIAPFVVNTLHGAPGVRSTGDTLATQTSRQEWGLVAPGGFLTSTNYYDDRNIELTDPMGTQTTQTKWGIAALPFMVEIRGTKNGMNAPKSSMEELGTFAAGGFHHGLVIPPTFLASYYGTDNISSVEEAVPTIPTVDRHALVTTMPFLSVQYSPGYNKAVSDAAATFTAQDHHALVTPAPFFIGYVNGDGPAHPISDPLLTFHTANGQALALPTHPPSVEDCGFRMLRPHEIQAGMAFPRDYLFAPDCTERDKVKLLGNAVTPPVMEMILERCVQSLG